MSCVNKASQQFKNCCKRLDLSEQQLEQIVYDYTNQQGNENTFPTDTYIEQQLKGIPTSELSDSQRKLYKLKYEEAQPLDTFEQVQQRVLELQQYYPDDRIRIIQRNNGKYQVVVNTDYSQEETEQEINQIKKEAIADGTFMKAPNGKPTNLTERQWLQVRSKAFKEWFGDWINNPTNASKVVDENGEPLVVYHGSTEEFDTFDVEYIGSNPSSENKGKSKINGFFFTDSYNSGRTYGPTKAVFLNIRQPALQKQKYKSYDSVTGVNSDGSLTYTKKYYGVNTFKDLSKLKIRLYNDGIIAEGLDDALIHKVAGEDAEEFNESLYGNDYIVFNPNQIKSATDNVGTFSREDNNIYQNREIIIPQAAQTLINNGLESLRQLGVVHRYNDSIEAQDIKATVKDEKERKRKLAALRRKNKNYISYYISKHTGPMTEIDKKGMSKELTDYLSDRKQYVIEYLSRYNTPKSAIQFDETKNAIRINIDENKVQEQLNSLNDRIAKNYADANFDTAFENKTEANNVRKILAYLSEKTGLSYEFISFKDAKKINKGIDINTNAFVKNNKVYFIQGRRLNTDIAAEEMLHPFVASIKILNKKAFNSLLKDATKAFPKLELDIDVTYTQSKDEELVTQALSRAFREDKFDYPEGHPIKDLIRNFFRWAKELFTGLFWNGGLPETITADMFQENLTIIDLAQIINSELKLDSGYIEGVRENRESSLEEFYTKQSVDEYVNDLMTIDNIKREGIKVEHFPETEDTDEYWVVSYIPQQQEEQYQWARTSQNRYEVSSKGDSRFSALNATFKPGTILFGHDVSGRTIESVYQHGVKQNDWTTDNNFKTGIPKSKEIIKGDTEDDSYRDGYLPLWQEWAKQNPEFIAELRQKAKGKVITDMFANTRVSQARALTDILNSQQQTQQTTQQPSIQQEEQPQEPSYEERQLAISEQVSNLINNDRGLKATELRQLSEQMVYWMSELISDCQDNPEKIFQILGITDYSNSDIEKVTLMSRKQIVQMIGVENMFNLCKSYVLTPDIDGTGKGNANINSRALRRQAELLKNNFQGLMQFSTSVWSTLEDFSIGLTATGYDTLETSNPDAFLDEEQIKERDKQADGESTQESWQVESNTIDALTTATQLVKRELLHCYLYENTGEVDDQGKPIKRIKTNKFGINERLNPREAINAIIKWVQGCWDLNSMVAALKEHQDKNPWVEQLVNKLSDITGNESDFQSQFFSCMCRSFQLYGVVNENNKRELYQHSINKNPMLQMAFNGIRDLYKVGEHPLLKLDGIDRKAFKEFHEDVEQLINYSKQKYSEIQNIDELNTLISHVYMLLGYYDATPEVVGAAMSDMTFKTLVQNLQTLRTYLNNEKLNKQYNPFDFNANNSIIQVLQNILKPITYIMDDYAVTQFFESGNMRQSNVIPSFMTKLFSKMQLPQKEFEEFVEKEYGQFDWFYDKKLKKYKNEWLSRLVRMPEEERKKLFEHKVQLSFNKKQYMRGMTDSEYAVSVISEYFTAGKQTAWYKVPIMSNKPTSEFIKFIKYDDSDYKDRIVVGMQHIFVQELGRIQTIIKRQNAGINKSDPRFIKNFDKNGARFCFLDFLNPFLNENKNTELGQLLNIKINGTRELSTEENARLNDLVKQEIRNSMEARVQQIMESWRQQGILTAVSQIQGFERKPEKAESNWESAANNAKIENFIWNDTFAAMEILQLTITDVAQYKDAEDLQKRLAQIHAPGVRGNIQARDYFGNQVSDGTHRAVYLTDFDDFISNVIDNVTKVFDKKIAEAPENEKTQWESLKESLVGKDGAYRQINVADAQAYACPTSYRKKAYMFGKWSREKEKMYQQLMSGQYDFSTLKQAFGEPLKPFLYSYEEVDAGVESSPIETFKIGVQNKDSEYLLIMADALTRNEDTGIPNILRAIYDIMEESHKVKNENGKYIASTDGIDDIQFESTVKAGLYGRINLKQFSTDPQGETNAKDELRSKIFDGQGGYNNTYIHETRYEDYCIQQEVPEHFKDHSQAHGSQIRYIIPSDLPLTNANGETIVYSYFDPATGTERKLDAKQFKAEYENHCATNIQESLDQLKEEFGLVTPDGQISFDRKQMNQTLSEILKREIFSSPRYGIDMLLACSLNADGEFNIPLGDPIQSRRIEQLINSIIKNRINKQKIAGGPVVQVTTFGTSRDLNIRFKSNKGGLLMTRKEFEKSKEEGTYEEYIEKYQDGIAYYEIYAPIYTNELFQQFSDRDGNIDIKRIEKENPELLKIIGYRIPTEDKYSCFPAKIVGFLPREAGDAVMLPADITAITGSDFDVDKMYLMRKEFKEEKKSKEEITKELEDRVLRGLTGKAKDVTQKQIEDFMNLREGEKEPAIKNNISNPIVKTYANMSKKKFVEYTEGRQYHNNMIIDMSYSVLTNKEIAYQVLNPGGFDQQKRMGYAIAAYKDPEVRSKYTFEQLMEMPIDGDGTTLKSLCYKNKNLAFFDTQVQFYKQNSAAGMILGMFAVQKIAHAILESDGFGIDLGKVFIDKNTNEQIPFGFCGMDFQGIVEVDRRFDANNQLIGKTLGSLVASAADAVKDPVLNLNNINNQTANVLTTMLRLGIVYEDAALLLSQPAITKVLQEHSKRMVNKEFISLNALIKSRMQELDDKYYMSESENIQSEPLNREDLIRGFSEENTVEAEKLEWKVLNAYLKFDQMSQIIKGLTNATRYNSVSNAVGPLIIDNLIMEYKAGKFSDAITYQGVEAKNINSVFNIHPILDKFSQATIIARRLLGEMPAYSSDFRILVNNSGDYTLSKIMGDRKLFSKLSDFYQSYLLVQSGFINPKDREYYTDKFPIEFMKYKEQYSDNPFVQAIRLSTGTFGGKTKGILTLDSVGMEQMQKDKLSSGWADLYKENPELAKKLFIYNFFKGGLGFSPKTFMNLVPISMKESIENNGIKYVDVYRHLPSLGNYSMIFDQFVGNNVGDFKLVPQRNPYSEHQNIQGNRIIITTKFENYELDYFKVKGFNNIYRIFKLQQVDSITKRKVFVEVPVLGNQGEFFDVSATPINKSNVTNTNTLEEEGFEPLDEEIVTEEGYDPYYTKIAIDIIKNERGLKNTKEAYERLKESRKIYEGLSEQEAEQRKADLREAIMKSFKRRNITFNEEELNKTTNVFC